MKALKNQIKESFFNPLLHFLPLLVFIVADDFWGMSRAWEVSFPVAIGMIFYVHHYYRRLFVWNATISASYLLISLGVSVTPIFSSNFYLFRYVDEIFFIILMLIFLADKRGMRRLSEKTLPNTLPLSNNLYEFHRIIKHLLLIVSLYLSIATLIHIGRIDYHYIPLLKTGYLISFSAVVAHEIIRIFLVRKKLFNEDWLPIVNTKGEVIGSFRQQNITAHRNKHPHLHPVVRCYFINNGMILLREKSEQHPFEPMLWDATISEHLRVGEPIEKTIKDSILKQYHIDTKKILHLTKYIHQNEIDHQFIYLSVTCREEVQPNSSDMLHVKWWTVKQIEDNLGKKVFTERFEKEYNILKRCGLTESNYCQCHCKLKETLLNESK